MALPAPPGAAAALAALSDRQPDVSPEGPDPAVSRGKTAMISLRAKYGWVLLLFVVWNSYAGTNARMRSSTFSLLDHAQGRWTVEYTPGTFSATPVTVSGRTYQFFGGDAASAMVSAGSPQLPVDALTLGLPWGS